MKIHMLSLPARPIPVLSELTVFNALSALLVASTLSLLTSFSARGQQALDQKAADPALDSTIKIVDQTAYAVATRDANQKIWAKTIWESNALTGELTARTNSYVELATASA